MKLDRIPANNRIWPIQKVYHDRNKRYGCFRKIDQTDVLYLGDAWGGSKKPLRKNKRENNLNFVLGGKFQKKTINVGEGKQVVFHNYFIPAALSFLPLILTNGLRRTPHISHEDI